MIRDWWQDSRRRRLHDNAQPGPVRDYLSQPWPMLDTCVDEVPLLAVDLETTGLDSTKHRIISAAWVPLCAQRIDLPKRQAHVVHTSGPMSPHNVVIHGLSDDQVAGGEALNDVLTALLRAMAGRVLVAHHAPLDIAFLAAACRDAWGSDVVFPCIDTLSLIRSSAQRRQQVLPTDTLTLSAARRRFGFPEYPAHDALWDAVGAAELWLGLRGELASGELQLSRVVTFLPN